VRDIQDYQKAGSELYERLHLACYPVAVKYIKDECEIVDGYMRPSKMKQKWAICQAITYARRWGWTSGMTADDNFCVPSVYSHQWEDISDKDFLQSQLLQKWHRNPEAEKKRIAHTMQIASGNNLEKMRQYKGVLCAPLISTPFTPDTVLTYGNGENITHIIHGLTYDGENYPYSTFEGFGEACIKGGLLPFITGIPQIVIPGMGDRAFSGAYDYEIAIGIPAELVFTVADNLFLAGGRQNMGQPVKTLLPMGLTEKITPGFQYLRDKLSENKHK